MHIHKSTFRHQVTFSDCDPAQLAYYPRMFEWFDWSTERLFRSVGLHWEEFFMKDGRAAMPLLDISAQFTYPCRLGDHITITTWIDTFAGSRFTVKHELMNR